MNVEEIPKIVKHKNKKYPKNVSIVKKLIGLLSYYLVNIILIVMNV